MLEVVFGDSEKGSVRWAKIYNPKRMKDGAAAVGYIGERPNEISIDEQRMLLEKQMEGQALGGDSSDVVNIGFHLDVGDISGEIDGSERRNTFRKLWGRFDFNEEEEEHYFVEQRKDLEKLRTSAKCGKPIRIWKSNASYSTCGLLYVCYLLRHVECDLRVVTLPEYKQTSENEMVRYTHWGEVEAGKLYQFTAYEHKVSDMEKQSRSRSWDELMKENGPLRAVVNGCPISVQEDFYDFIILNNLPEEDFMMARIIGKLIGEYNLGISDSWYAYRLEHMISQGSLILVDNKDPTHPYGKILRKV